MNAAAASAKPNGNVRKGERTVSNITIEDQTLSFRMATIKASTSALSQPRPTLSPCDPTNVGRMVDSAAPYSAIGMTELCLLRSIDK